MAKKIHAFRIVEEKIISKIYMIRGMKVMLDFELAELYKTETRQLKRQVRRNVERFPDDFLPPQVVELPSFGLRPTTYKSTHLISTLKNS